MVKVPSSETKVLIFRFSVERGLYRPIVKCGIPEFRHGIPDAYSLDEKDFIAILNDDLSILVDKDGYIIH